MWAWSYKGVIAQGYFGRANVTLHMPDGIVHKRKLKTIDSIRRTIRKLVSGK